MSAAARDVQAGRRRLVECRAIIGGEHDAFLLVWDEQASSKDRRVMLTLAGEPPQSAGFYAGYAWRDLSPEMRGRITGAMRRFKTWSERLQ